MSEDAVFSQDTIIPPEALLESRTDSQVADLAGEVVHSEILIPDRLDPANDGSDGEQKQDDTPQAEYHDEPSSAPVVPFPEHFNGTNNTDKALVMGSVEDKLRTDKSGRGLPPWTKEDADSANRLTTAKGDEYELRGLADKEAMEPAAFLEYMNQQTSTLLHYGSEIIAHQEDFGEAPSPNQELFKTIAAFIEKHPEAGQRHVGVRKKRDGRVTRLMIGSDRQPEFSGQLVFEAEQFGDDITREYWMVEPWKTGSNLGISRPGDYVKEEMKDNTDGYDHVSTTSKRRLTKEDRERLTQLLADFDKA